MRPPRRLHRTVSLQATTLALGALALACGITDPDDRPFEASEPFSHTVPFSGDGSLRLDGVSGPIEIAGDPTAAAVTIEGVRRVSASSRSQARQSLDELEVRVTPTGDRVTVRTIQPADSRTRSFEVEYRIVVPAGFHVTVTNTNGRIDLADIDGDVAATLVNGDAGLSALTGAVELDLVNGQIDAELDPAGPPLIDLATVNGRIDLGIPASVSAMLAAGVVNGTVTVSQLSLHDVVQSRTSLRARLGSGAGTIDLSLVNGDIRVAGR